MVRSPIEIVGLLLVLSGCATQDANHNVKPTSVPISPSSAQEQEVAQPFQELLTQAETDPPRLIPELAPTQTSLPETADSSKLPPVPVAATDAPLSVPLPPAPAIVQTVPIPNSNPPVRVASRPVASVASPQPSSRQPSVATRSPSATARSPVPRVVRPTQNAAQPPTAQPQAVATQSPASVPSRSLAESVQVTGVVHAGNTVSAIVQVPNEQSSRYVRAGDYLANGSILVSRIEITPNNEARVVLVQNGVQTVKTVGNF